MTAKDIKERDVNKLMEDVGVFFAFSNEQFEQGIKKLGYTLESLKANNVKITDIGYGGFILSERVNDYIAGMRRIGEAFDEAMRDEKARRDYIAYELNNHEAYYTRSIDSTLEALGDSFTREEVLAVFDGRRKAVNI